MTDPGRSGGEGTGWHMHAGRYVHRALCAGTPVIVLDPVTARDTIARVVYWYDRPNSLWHEQHEAIKAAYLDKADHLVAALASQERGE